MKQDVGVRRERELNNMFDDQPGWVALRAPGSGGGTGRDRPDILVGGGPLGVFAFEVKARASNVQKPEGPIYVTQYEADALHRFAASFKAQPFIAVKWPYLEWEFWSTRKLRTTNCNGNFAIDHPNKRDDDYPTYLTFEDLIGEW